MSLSDDVELFRREADRFALLHAAAVRRGEDDAHHARVTREVEAMQATLGQVTQEAEQLRGEASRLRQEIGAGRIELDRVQADAAAEQKKLDAIRAEITSIRTRFSTQAV